MLALTAALLCHPIHSQFIYRIGTFHLQVIENLTNRVLNRSGFNFFHATWFSRTVVWTRLCVFLFCLSQHVALLDTTDNHGLKYVVACLFHIQGRTKRRTFFYFGKQNSSQHTSSYLLLSGTESYLWQKQNTNVFLIFYFKVFLCRGSFRPLGF